LAFNINGCEVHVGRRGQARQNSGSGWREYRNTLQFGKGVYVSMKIKYIIACVQVIFIDYLALIVCVAVERVEALFCHDFWLLFIYGKSNINKIYYYKIAYFKNTLVR